MPSWTGRPLTTWRDEIQYKWDGNSTWARGGHAEEGGDGREWGVESLTGRKTSTGFKHGALKATVAFAATASTHLISVSSPKSPPRRLTLLCCTWGRAGTVTIVIGARRSTSTRRSVRWSATDRIVLCASEEMSPKHTNHGTVTRNIRMTDNI